MRSGFFLSSQNSVGQGKLGDKKYYFCDSICLLQLVHLNSIAKLLSMNNGA